MTQNGLRLPEIVSWLESKRRSLEGSGVSLVEIRERTEHLPAAAAEFAGAQAMGRINGWTSGEFDFEAIRVSDGRNYFWRHLSVSSTEELESAYCDFIRGLLKPETV